MIAAAFILPLVVLAQACESMAGGPVRSAADYGKHTTVTKEAGKRTVSQLRPAPYLAGALRGASLEGTANEEGSPSCKDDLGADGDGVTRDQPIYSWKLEFDSRHDYLTVVKNLREEWSKRGLTVEHIPAPAKGEPGQGLPGISTIDDRGINLMFGPDRYSGAPTVRADGGCIRHLYH
ncbi:hypothetical protein ADL29_24865 [Streptomyces chattanoogensis]|uniref:Lipoprotein n=1 Tax=Streptomyces chattanoogensis TaxID=66876 RepID=A0A0N0GXS4_9ACTN|nr:hypothetical protein ADL29_24865 [Streptomyces chattanoogensis]